MRGALVIAAAFICMCMPTAVAGPSDDSVVLSISLKQEVDAAPMGLTGPSLRFEQGVAQTLPFTSVNISTDDVITGLPLVAETDFISASSENGTPIIRSGLLPAGYFTAPASGWYHDGALDFRWAASDTRVPIHDGVRRAITQSDNDSQMAMGELLRQEREQAFTATDPAVNALPEVYYEIDTRTVGVDVVTEAPRGHRVKIDELYVWRNQTESQYLLPDSEESLSLALEPTNAPPSLPITPDPIRKEPRQPEPGNLTTYTMEGEPHSPPNVLIIAAAVATVGMAVVLFLLYSLYQPKELLKNDVRAKIYAAIEANPGITVARLAEIAGVKHQTASYHLKFLRKAGYVRDMECGNRRLHFISGAGLSEEDRTLLTISNDVTTMKILQLIEEKPGIIKRDLAPQIGLTRTAGTWHVNKLVNLGLVTETREHGHCYLSCVPERQTRLRELLSRPEATPAIEKAVNIPVMTADGPLPKPASSPGPA